MAIVLQANRVPRSNSSTIVMDPYTQLEQSTEQMDSFHQKIFDTVTEGKRDRDPHKCREILNDFSTILKRLTAMVNEYNLAFGETRPPFYMQEFQRLTDQIETVTKARDIITEYLHELEDRNLFDKSSSSNDVSTMHNQFEQQLQYSPIISHSARSSPPDSRPPDQHRPSTSSIYSSNNDHSTSTDPYFSQQSSNPNSTSNNFIRVHFPNKHTTALAPSDKTLAAALEFRAPMHSVTNLHDYTPVYMRSRQQCRWDIPLNRLLEKEIELEEKTKLDHSFVDIRTRRFRSLFRVHCVVCDRRIRDDYKRCTSCGNSYHNQCCIKAPVCSHPILQHIKHLGPDRFHNDRTNACTQSKEKSRSLPRIPIPRPSITPNPGVGPQKDVSQDPLAIPTNVGYFSNTILSPSLPSAATPLHHIPQFLLMPNGSPMTSPESLRPSRVKPTTDTISNAPKQRWISDWEIPPEDLLNHGRMVGRGTYGTVYKAEVRLHGNVALKELNFVSPTPPQLQAFRNEVIALKRIAHQNTLNFYGYILSPRFAIVTQWCEGSTLHKHLHVLDRPWKIKELILIALQICQGMSYLHDRGIIHRDLKSSNVFLDTSAEAEDSYRVKIGDFGLAAVKTMVIDGTNQQMQPTGSVLWMAPEVIQQKDPNCYSTSSDVYAYGCVLFEMFSGRLPHAPITTKEMIMYRVAKGTLKIKVEQCRDDTPDSIVELIRICTEYDRDLRPNFVPEIECTLSKFEVSLPRCQRSQSEPCLSPNFQEDLIGLSIGYGNSRTPLTIHRRFNNEES